MAKKMKYPTTETEEKNPVGAPTKYRPEYIEQLIEYFSAKISTVNSMGTERPSDFPSLAGFAIKIGVAKDTLYEWSKVYPDFSVAYKRAKDFQENWLLVNGNKGLIPPNFGIFTAKNVIGYRDRQPDEVDTTIINNNAAPAMSEKELDAAIEAKMQALRGKV